MKIGSTIALATSLFFVNLQIASADDVRAAMDGSCPANDGSGHGGGHGCGFLGLGCVGDAIAHAWDDTGGKVVHAVATVASTFNPGAFFPMFLRGLVFGVVGFAAFTALTIFAPVLVPFVIVAGAAFMLYSGVKLGMNWGRLNNGQRWGVVGQITGGLVGGVGAGAVYSSITSTAASGTTIGLDGASGEAGSTATVLSAIPKPPLAPFQPTPDDRPPHDVGRPGN